MIKIETNEQKRIRQLEAALKRSVDLLEEAQEILRLNSREINKCKYLILTLSRVILVVSAVTLLLSLTILL